MTVELGGSKQYFSGNSRGDERCGPCIRVQCSHSFRTPSPRKPAAWPLDAFSYVGIAGPSLTFTEPRAKEQVTGVKDMNLKSGQKSLAASAGARKWTNVWPCITCRMIAIACARDEGFVFPLPNDVVLEPQNLSGSFPKDASGPIWA